MTIIEFLTARIDEDERWALAEMREEPGYRGERRWRECEAKRRIIAQHPYEEVLGGRLYCQTCDDGNQDYPCATLRALAWLYSDQTEFNQAWA